jgi:hypothetical protein
VDLIYLLLKAASKKGSIIYQNGTMLRLRYAYWLAAVSAIRQRENSFRYKYERYVRNNPTCADTKRKARVAVATKLARVAHALVKTNTDYRGYYEMGHET